MLTQDTLRRLWPRAPSSTVAAIARTAENVFASTGINTPLRQEHFLAQISHECGAGTIVRENMNYSARRLMEIFGVGRHSAKITEAEAQRLAGHPELIAERVYGLGNPSKARELGNTQPGDGFRYRGNGMLQLTGRASHRRIGQMVGLDLEAHPELLEDAATSFRVAAQEFVALNCLSAADADDVVLVTRRVNGGRNGLAERTVWLRRWKAVLDGVEEPVKAPRAAPSVEAKPLMQSKIAQGGVAGVGLTSIVAGGQIAETVRTVSDATSTARDVADNATTVATAAKPLLSLPLSILLSVAATLAVCACVYVIWQRYKKLRDQGV